MTSQGDLTRRGWSWDPDLVNMAPEFMLWITKLYCPVMNMNVDVMPGAKAAILWPRELQRHGFIHHQAADLMPATIF